MKDVPGFGGHFEWEYNPNILKIQNFQFGGPPYCTQQRQESTQNATAQCLCAGGTGGYLPTKSVGGNLCRIFKQWGISFEMSKNEVAKTNYREINN